VTNSTMHVSPNLYHAELCEQFTDSHKTWHKLHQLHIDFSSVYITVLSIDSMLPCVCSVISWSLMTSNCCKNNKKGARGESRVCHWCSYHILTSSGIYYWTDARQHGF